VVAEMNKYDVYFYRLDLYANNFNVFLWGNAEMHARVTQPITAIFMELHDSMVVDSIKVNGSLRMFSHNGGVIQINLTDTIKTGSRFLSKVYYHGFSASDNGAAIGKGLTNSTNRKVTWSLSQPFSAYEWWPCKQVLTDKADSSEVIVTTDTMNKVGSNGVLIQTNLIAANQVQYYWKSSYPINYYLISIAVGPYTEYNTYAHPTNSDSVLIQNYIYRNATASVKSALDLTPGILEAFSKVFGPYPFAKEKYGHSQAPLSGGMEHQTMTTQGVFSFDIIAHELAHQWFGDWVTCSSWSDIWVNEGFASYCEYLANQLLNTGSAQSWLSNAMSSARVGQKSNVFVYDSMNTSRIFSSTVTYNKGAILLHMMRYEINNDSVFYLTLRNYLQTYQKGNASGNDFKKIAEATTGINFTPFFNQWYYGSGFPSYQIRWNQIGNKVWVQIKQSATDSLVTPLFVHPVDLRFVFAGGDSVFKVKIDSASKTFVFTTAKTLQTLQFDAADWILNDQTIVKDLTTWAETSLLQKELMVFFPNPSQNEVSYFSEQAGELYIYNTAGKEVLKYIVSAGHNRLSLGMLDRGVYYVSLATSEGLAHGRIVLH
jgi:aminopeptidase N